MAPIISARELHKTFDGLQVLKGASLDVEEGEAMAVVGQSGDGKTVFLKHLAGLMQPDSGQVFVNGKDLCCLRGRELRELRSRLGYVFQGGALFQSMTVFENVAFPLREKTSLDDEAIRERVELSLSRVGLTGAEKKYPAEISGGMVKRVALARLLVRRADVMFLDEPTTGLDPIIVHEIHDLVESLREKLSITAVIVTHEIPNIFPIVDRVAMLHEGRIRYVGTPTEILHCEDKVVHRFIEESMPPERFRIARETMS